jgi:hypothetical protein
MVLYDRKCISIVWLSESTVPTNCTKSDTDILADAKPPQKADSTAQSQQSRVSNDDVQERKKGASISETQDAQAGNLRHEIVDASYHVRDATFFNVGRVFSVIVKAIVNRARDSSPTDYNSSQHINVVEHGNNKVSTSVRTMVVVRSKDELCYVCDNRARS